MRTELPAVSFLCMGLLALLSPIVLHSRNVAGISLVVWLFCCNLIHGVDAVVWAGNTVVHAPVWCDIATRVLLAAQLAIPGCCLALARNIRRCAMGHEVTRKTYTYMQDLTFCLIIPIIYVVFHVIVQPHRFDIVQDFGCFASIYTSSVSLIIVWIPPLVFCIITFAYAALAVRARLDSGLVFFSHMQDAPHLNIFAAMRPILTSILIALTSISITVFSAYARTTAIGGLKTWSVDTWDRVHAHMSEAFIVPPRSLIDLTRTEVEWWAVPACSFVLIFMTGVGLVCQATDSPRLARWFRTAVLQRTLVGSFANTSKAFRGDTLHSTPSSPIFGGEDKSSWDDIWRPTSPPKVKLARLAIPATSPATSPSPTSTSADRREDAFVQSTRHYIESPTGRKALGLPPLAPVLFPPGQPQADLTPPSPPRVSPTPPHFTLKTKPPINDKTSRPDSLLSAPWPRPPSTVPPSPSPRTPSPKYGAPITIQPPSPTPAFIPSFERPASLVSIPTSFASSTLSMGAYPFVYDDLEPHVPFQDHIVDLESAGPGLVVPRHVRKMRSRDVLLPRSLSASSRRRNGSDGMSGGIYMTVVKEMA